MAIKLKPSFKRPWLHHIIIICYIGAPFANILLLVAFLHVPLGTIVRNLAAGYGILATLWLFTAPIVGVSLYFVRKFSWYVFLGHSSLILLDFIFKWITKPAYYLHTIAGLHNILLLLGNMALVGIVTYIIQRDFRSPYFQILNRHWRERKRIPIYHTVLINGQTRIMSDLSSGGCFVEETDPRRILGEKVSLSFQSSRLNIDCMGEVLRITNTGIGIRFVRLPMAKRRDVRYLLRNRFSLRHKVDLPCGWIFQNDTNRCTIVDLSSSGCFLQAQSAGLGEGSSGKIQVFLPCNRHSYSLPGKVIWINRLGMHEKPIGFGFRFSHRQTRFMRDVTRHYGRGMLVR